jgi:spermidine synthase
MSTVAESAIFIPSPVIEGVATRTLVAGVALSSFSALLLELSLTRLFSVILFYHFAFLAISIALLGLGAGGVFAHLLKRRLSRIELRSLMFRLCVLNAVVIPLILEAVLHSPVSLDVTWNNFLHLSAIYAASSIPFFITGVEFSVIFARQPRHISRLYGADLFGGALACLAIVPLLNRVGGPNTILFTAFIAAIAAVVWAPGGAFRRWSLGMSAAVLFLIAANYSGRLMDVVYAKGKLRDKSSVEFARWNAISRVEVDRVNDAKAIVIDADANTYIMNADPAQWRGSVWQKNLMAAPPAIANVLRPHGDYAIIGPGGGVDVLRAVANGSPNVTGIEINPIIANTIMRGRYADYAFHLYDRPDVHMHVTDGRSFIRNSKQKFDVVQMTLVDTWASTAAGAFALSENNLYTVNAFREYFDHLNPDGIIAITRWEFQRPREALRVVAVAMEALHRLGIPNPAENFIVVSEGRLDEPGIPVAVLSKKSPFTRQEEEMVRAHVAANPVLTLQYSPSHPEDNSFSKLIASNDPYAFAKQYAYNVAPVTDNAPFFFFTLKLGQVLDATASHDAIDWNVNLGVAVLLMVLGISVISVVAFLIVPLALRRAGSTDVPAIALLYFVAIGLGYIIVEITFIQRFVLFLGHPTYAVTVVVFLMLLSSGAGSMSSQKWLRNPAKHAWLPLLLIVIALLFYVAIIPPLLNSLVGLPFTAKLLVSAALLIPLGFIMGMPFPTGLRSLAIPASMRDPSAEFTGPVEWAWALNAGASVLGSVTAILIAIQFGLNVTLCAAVIAYGAALLLTRALPTTQAI